MVYQPPAGTKDLLPLDVNQKCWIEERLEQVFQQWGYHRIITSTLERLETLMAGGAIHPSTVIQLQTAIEGESLGLRPELTASIARAAVTRMAGAAYPQRLYYMANVFRRAISQTSHQEFYQAGVELLGTGGLMADGEILLLLAQCLNQLCLENWSILLGEAGLTRSLLSPFPEKVRQRIRQAIVQLDRVTLETLPLETELRERALFLMDLRGQPTEVLQRVATLDLDQSQRTSLDNVKSLIECLGDLPSHPSTASEVPALPKLVLDLSLIQPFDYYTGIVFEVVCQTPSGQRVLAQGGRYDQLLGLYHSQGVSEPGIGFSLNLDEIHQALLPSGCLPQSIPVSDWLVVPVSSQAFQSTFAYAQHLREANHGSVELELSRWHNPAAVRDYAQYRHIAQIAWVQADGTATMESL